MVLPDALDRCELATEAMNRVLAHVAGLGLGPARDTRAHTGVWRHLILRDAGTPESPAVLAGLVTTSAAPEDEVRAVGAGIAALPGVRSVVWITTDRLSEVAQGDLRAVLHGPASMEVRLGGVTLQLPHDAFFQVNTEGAEVLLETIEEALLPDTSVSRADAGTLLDLYCGVGAIGLALQHRFANVIGIELHDGAIASAQANARRNGIQGAWHAGPVEDVLPGLDIEGPRRIIVDPLALACIPERRARQRLPRTSWSMSLWAQKPCARPSGPEAGGWRLTDLWSVDCSHRHTMERPWLASSDENPRPGGGSGVRVGMTEVVWSPRSDSPGRGILG